MQPFLVVVCRQKKPTRIETSCDYFFFFTAFFFFLATFFLPAFFLVVAFFLATFFLAAFFLVFFLATFFLATFFFATFFLAAFFFFLATVVSSVRNRDELFLFGFRSPTLKKRTAHQLTQKLLNPTDGINALVPLG